MTEDHPSLGRQARRACDAALAADEIALSSIVFYEAGLLLRRGRVEGPATVRQWRGRLMSLGMREFSLTTEIAIVASELDDLHGDPFDRIIVATALVEDAVLLTADRSILTWPGRMHRRDARR